MVFWDSRCERNSEEYRAEALARIGIALGSDHVNWL